MLIAIILIILIFGGLGAGVYGHSAGWGYYGWSPAGLLLVVLVIWLLLGGPR